ncbi:hypothetical protein Tco_1162366, partial [Tanacetum coccineum]
MGSVVSNRDNVGTHFFASCGKQKALESLVIPWQFPCGLSEIGLFGTHIFASCEKQNPLESLVILWQFPCGLSEVDLFLN